MAFRVPKSEPTGSRSRAPVTVRSASPSSSERIHNDSDEEMDLSGAGAVAGRAGAGKRRRAVVDDDEDDDDDDEAAEDGLGDDELREGGDEAKGGIMLASPLVRDPKDGYVTGSITRIKCVNFLTYDHVEFSPGPDLNLILGPNGTGKSAICAAMVMGLGYPPKVLGRASKIREYVKTGTQNCTIEVELKGAIGKKNTIIKRYMSSDSEKTTFDIDGKSATATALKAKLQSLHVSVDNLCTFLPQDRVSQFASLSSSEYLKETQKAAGTPKLTAWHDTLIAERKQQSALQDTVDVQIDTLKSKINKNMADLQQVKQLQERIATKRTLDVLQVVLPFAKYSEARIRALDAKTLRTQYSNEMLILENANLPFVQSKAGLAARTEKYERDLAKGSSKIKTCRKDANEVVKQLDAAEKKVEGIRKKLEEAKMKGKSRASKIIELEKLVQKYQKQVDNKPPEQDMRPLKEQIMETKARKLPLFNAIDEAKDNAEEATRQGHALNKDLRVAENSLKQLSNVIVQREVQMKQFSPACHAFMMWCRAHQADFVGKVYDPVRIAVSPRHTGKVQMALAEAGIAMAAFGTVVCERQEDYNLIMREGVDKKQCKGDAVELPAGRTLQRYIDLRRERLPDDVMKSWGFDCYAIDLISGPDLVLAYLCETQSLHLRPICLTEKKKLNYAAIQNCSLIKRFYTPEGSQSQKQSLYGSKELLLESRPLNDAKVFFATEDREEMERLARHCQELRANLKNQTVIFDECRMSQEQLRKQILEIDELLNTLERKKGEMESATKNWNLSVISLNSKTIALNSARQVPTEEKLQLELREKMSELTEKRIVLATRHAEFLLDATTLSVNHSLTHLRHLQASSDQRAIDNTTNGKDQEIADKREQLAAATANALACRQMALPLLDLANTAADDATADIQVAAEERRQEGESVEVLEEAILLEEARLNNGQQLDPAIEKRYEARKIDIAKLEEKLAESRQSLEVSTASIEKVKALYHPAIEQLVNTVSQKFSTAFDGMGLLGEVRLVVDADYDKWGIEIMVAFRDNEEMRVLSATRQSGGERALSTIMYLMSLAEIARGPFSLVDEINQGMDQRVERQVHNQLVATTCSDSVGQYFLLTPKLLAGLDYHPKMKILIINNGDWLPETLSLKSLVKMRMAMRSPGSSRGSPISV